MPRIGTRKLYALIKPELELQGIKLGRDGLFDYLRTEGLLVKPRKTYTKTTFSKHWMRKYPNLIKETSPEQVESVFVSDITYLKSDEGTHYLSLITDACSRKIMGYHISNDMATSNVVKALDMAEGQRQLTHDCIHHSDRGLQYCADEYQTALRGYGMTPSMTDGCDCYQNALAERINGILKQEFLLYPCRNKQELDWLVSESIDVYNGMRPHLCLGMKTPNQVHNEKSQLVLATGS